jgi:two-component system, OmpR family, response regulator
MAHLLIVEDDELLRDGLAAQLTQSGHTITAAQDGAAAIAAIDNTRFDGVVLDLGLPKVDGMDVLRWVRLNHGALPVLVLTARDGVEDRVQGLNAGADDYLTKPFSLPELQARVAAMLRRSQLPAFGGTREIAAGAGLRVDAHAPRAWLGERELEVTAREWELLSLLVANAGQVVSRDDVLSRWQQSSGSDGSGGAGGEGSNALEVYIFRLRKKLDGCGLQIRNVRGLGYMLEKDAA